ncbi:GNAT family N-acetyltransferase [Leadbetterella byssophila]|uniref:GNAT family N-acetyltransferase n=1 Tax=Leadbetterella byssophila TaxID=316068 RepID=UPI0039A059F2
MIIQFADAPPLSLETIDPEEAHIPEETGSALVLWGKAIGDWGLNLTEKGFHVAQYSPDLIMENLPPVATESGITWFLEEGIYIRQFKVGDERSFAELNYAWISEYFVVEEEDEWVLFHPHEAILDQGGIILFACKGQELIGTVSLIIRNDEEVELSKMTVEKSYRGKGLGGFLVSSALYLAKGFQQGKVILFTNSLLDTAVRLYSRLGFKRVDVKGKLYRRADVKMELSLFEDLS